MAERLIYIGLDVGGTTMKAAAVADSGKPLAHPVVTDTHPERGQDAGLETMCETIRRAVAAASLSMADVAAIGVATPGLMDIRAGLIPGYEPVSSACMPDIVYARWITRSILTPDLRLPPHTLKEGNGTLICKTISSACGKERRSIAMRQWKTTATIFVV